MRKLTLYLLTIIVIASLLALGVVGCAEEAPTPTPTPTPAPTPPPEEPPLKIGALIPYTGMAAHAGPMLEGGLEMAFEEVGWEVAGRKIELIKEDPSDDPGIGVAKTKKLVENDKVALVTGFVMGSTILAAEVYLESMNVPQIGAGVCPDPTSKHAFYVLGSIKGNVYPVGSYAYDELGARKAAVFYMENIYGELSADAFIESFTERGGTIVCDKVIPMMATNVAPFLEDVGDADIIAVQLNMPTDVAFVKMYREFGLEIPVFFITNAPQGAFVLAQMGDDALGMYGASGYSPLIDTPFNKEFVGKYTAKYEFPPDNTVQAAYTEGLAIIEALKATGGDTSSEKLTEALLGIKDLENPGGMFSFNPGRVGIIDLHISQVVSLGGGMYEWGPIYTVSGVEPR